MEGLYNFKFGDDTGEDRDNKPEVYENNQLDLMRKRVPTLCYIDAKESESMVSIYNGRMVDFKEAFLYDKNIILNYIQYFRNFQNLFDLEFFASKLPSTAFSIAGLEQCALSGVPFWEDEDDDGDLTDEYLENQQVNRPM